MPRYRTSRAKPVEPRFWAAVDKSGGPDACWLWTRALSKAGYGQIGVNGGVKYAHRVSWEIHHGPIPQGMFVCHDCPDGDNPQCVNPAHLFLGTSEDNQKDMMRKGRGNKVIGVRSPTAKLNPDKVREIRRLDAEGVNRNTLALQFGVSLPTVDCVRRGKTWRQVS